MATLKNLKPDQILYKVRKEKAGHTTKTFLEILATNQSQDR